MPRFKWEAISHRRGFDEEVRTGVIDTTTDSISMFVAANLGDIGGVYNLVSLSFTRISPLVVEMTESERDWMLELIGNSIGEKSVDLIGRLKNAKPNQ